MAGNHEKQASKQNPDQCMQRYACGGVHRGTQNWLSEEERRVDALALRAEERRDKLRKAAGSGKYTLIRRYLNGETHVRRPYVPCNESIVVRREPGELKHLSSRRRRKKKELKFLSIPKVAASEMGRAQTGVRALRGSDCIIDLTKVAEWSWEDQPQRVKAP